MFKENNNNNKPVTLQEMIVVAIIERLQESLPAGTSQEDISEMGTGAIKNLVEVLSTLAVKTLDEESMKSEGVLTINLGVDPEDIGPHIPPIRITKEIVGEEDATENSPEHFFKAVFSDDGSVPIIENETFSNGWGWSLYEALGSLIWHNVANLGLSIIAEETIQPVEAEIEDDEDDEDEEE